MAEPSKETGNISEPITFRLLGREVSVPRGWWVNPFVMIPLLAVLVYLLLLFFGDNGIIQSNSLRKEVNAGERYLDSIRAENELLSRRVDSLKAKQAFNMEEEARLMGMIKPGERVYILKPDTANPKAK